jgi:hypothetical protein
MLHLTWFDWILVGLVPTISLLMGLYLRRSQQKPSGWVDYFLARTKLSTTNTISNYVGANLVFTAIFLVLSLEGARRGMWVLSIPIAFFVGTLLLLYLYPKLVPFLEQGETLHQALGSVFDKGQTGWNTVRRWASLWTILAFVGGVGLEFYGGVLLLKWAGVPQLSSVTLAIILAFICATFTIVGGLRGISKINTFLDGAAFLGIFIFFGLILWTSYNSTGSLTPISTSELSVTLTDNIIFTVGAFFIFVPLQLCALDTWQRGVAWEKKKRIEVAGPLLFGAFLICVASFVAFTAGNYVRVNGLMKSDEHPLLTMMTNLEIPSSLIGFPLIGLIIAGFVAAILSTADELLNCCGYAVLADFLNLPRSEEVDEETSKAYIKSGKFYTGVFAFVSAALAVGALALEKQITDIANVAFSTQVVFIMPLLFAFYYKKAHKLHLSALLAMLIAFLTALIMTVLAWMQEPDEQSWIDGASLVAFIAGLIVMVVGWGLTKLFVKKNEHVEE